MLILKWVTAIVVATVIAVAFAHLIGSLANLGPASESTLSFFLGIGFGWLGGMIVLASEDY